jgi:hypothetical protein
LMVAALEVEFGLLAGGDDRRGLDRLFLSANVLHLHVGGAHLMKDGFDDFPVGTGKNLAENSTGNLDENSLRIVAIEAGRLEPGGVGIDADPGLDEVEKFIPDVWSFAFAADLCSSYHRYRFEKSQKKTISTGVKKLWKANLPH